MVVIDMIIVTQIDSMTQISDTNSEIQKTHTTHTTNTEEDHIIKDNKLIKIQIIKSKLSLLRRGHKFTPISKGNSLNLKSDIFDFTRRIQMEEIFYDQGYQDELLVSNKSNRQFKSKDLELQIFDI